MKYICSFIFAVVLFCNNVYGQTTEYIDSVIWSVDQTIPSFVKIGPNTESYNRRNNKNTKKALTDLLSLDKNISAVLVDTLTDVTGGFHESYREYYKGIEVEGTRATVHFNNVGEIVSINGNFRTINSVDINPSITIEKAVQNALSNLNSKLLSTDQTITRKHNHLLLEESDIPASNRKLVVYPWNEKIYLAYKINIDSNVTGIHISIYIDAHNGAVLNTINNLCSVTANVNTLFSGIRTITTQFNNGSYRLRDYDRGDGIETYDYSSSNDYTSTDNSWSGLSTYDRAALDIHWGVEQTYDYYLNKFSRNSFDNNGATIKSYVNMPEANAYWTGSQLEFGIMNNVPLVDLDITAHELTHAITQETSNLTYYGESGALNEGMSDIFAAAIEKYVKPNNDSLIWLIGETVQTGGIRDMRNPSTKFYHGINWYPVVGPDNGGVHMNSGVINYWFYLLVNGGSGVNEAGITYNVTGIGMDKAVQICYLMNTAYFANNYKFTDACVCSYLAAEQLGYGSDVEQIRNAWIAVGVETPSNITISGSSLICNSESYYVDNLPSGYNVTWELSGISAANFSINQNQNQCTVTKINGNNMQFITLTAILTYNYYTVKRITKNIITHSTSLDITGTQEEYYGSSGYYPEQSISYSVLNTGSGFVSDTIHVNGDCDINLHSFRFSGMNISFSPLNTPTNITHNGANVSFHTNAIFPLFPTPYTFRLMARSNGGCYDFDLIFKVSPFPYLNSPELQLSISNNTLYAHLTEAVPTPIGGGLYQQATWTLRIYRVSTGQLMTTKYVTGSDTSVDISSYASGLYTATATYDGQTYSTKFIK